MTRLPSHLASLQRLLDDAITVELIAEPLYFVDGATDCATVAVDLKVKGFDECGVRLDGPVRHFVRALELDSGTVGKQCQVVPPERIVTLKDSLWPSMEPLARHGSLYLSGDSGLDGIVTRADLNKQPARLLMFGIVSMLEMTLLELIRTYYQEESWRDCLKLNRIEMAEELHRERQKRNEDTALADCLQLCDKATLCIASPPILAAWGLGSNKCRKLFSRLGNVRDNLAHAQRPATDGDLLKVLSTLNEGRSVLACSVQMLSTSR